MKRMDPLWLSLAAGRVVQTAQVPYQIARRLIRAGMDEAEAAQLAAAWRRTGRDIDEIIRVWRRSQPRHRRGRRIG